MTAAQPRMRMLAGPNGSGKTTIKRFVAQRMPGIWLGVDVNPDDIEKELVTCGTLSLDPYGIELTSAEAAKYFRTSALALKAGFAGASEQVSVDARSITFGALPLNSYVASVAAALLRERLIQQQLSFTFETVMSSPDKVEILRQAQAAGYRTYLYFVATEDVEINVSRVALRVAQKGHDVPRDKIISRYARTLELLPDAIRSTNRAYIFDNSADEPTWIAEITEASTLEMKVASPPGWFRRSVLDKFRLSPEK